MNSFQEKIEFYISAQVPILYLNTYEEEKAERTIASAASALGNIDTDNILVWDGTDRICAADGSVRYELLTEETLTSLLDDRLEFSGAQVLILKNIDTFIDDPGVIARLKKMASSIHSGKLLHTRLVIVSPVLRIPRELEKFVTVLEIGYLSVDEIQTIIHRFLSEQEASVSEELERQFANDLKGLTEFEIKNIMELACASSAELSTAQRSFILEQKQQMIKKAGIIEMVPLKESLNDIGGLEVLKAWLERKKKVLGDLKRAQDFGVDIPKGVLIAGVPGCGKSLSAKAAANLFNLPLLRLDMGRLLGKYVGESEANMRKAIELAEAVSPCVLWIDELEKAFAGIGGDGSGAEVTTRLFGTFLTWMQEKDSPVFVVATANNITNLPPELLRKGRFDEIFFVGLPNRMEREKIFEIHIRKRRPKDLDEIWESMSSLVSKTDKYSGADIEGVVRESVEQAYSEKADQLKPEDTLVTAQDILTSIANTHPLYEIMKKEIDEMETTYRDRKFKNASEVH